ncbi:DUF6198 family protein [Lactobacillaceae bacterium L1_55_11]|nr:DUF6198 family protein [Lactobacillaceae bacterium L1_55_11]
MNKKSIALFILFVVGLNVLSLGTVVFTTAKLGVSALVSLPLVLSHILPLTLGQATSLIFVIYVSLEIILQKSFRLKTLLQLILAFAFGWLVDFYGLTVGLERLHVSQFGPQIMLTLLAILLTALGIFMMVQADFVLIPPDGLVNVLSQKTGHSFGQTKFLFDATMIMLSLALGLTFLHRPEGIGIGTLLAVLMVGQLIRLFDFILFKFFLKEEHSAA